jgi:hypothetical protein
MSIKCKLLGFRGTLDARATDKGLCPIHKRNVHKVESLCGKVSINVFSDVIRAKQNMGYWPLEIYYS